MRLPHVSTLPGGWDVGLQFYVLHHDNYYKSRSVGQLPAKALPEKQKVRSCLEQIVLCSRFSGGKKECILGRLFTFLLSRQGKLPSPANSPPGGLAAPSCQLGEAEFLLLHCNVFPSTWAALADHRPQGPDSQENEKQPDTCGASGGWRISSCLPSCRLQESPKF